MTSEIEMMIKSLGGSQLIPFRKIMPCPKCGALNTSISYHLQSSDRQKFYPEMAGQGIPYPRPVNCHGIPAGIEHLHRYCRGCTFMFMMRTKDWKGEKKR